MVRMDSAYYTAAVIATVRRNGARFSVTDPQDTASRTKGKRQNAHTATTCENRSLRKIPFRIQSVD